MALAQVAARPRTNGNGTQATIENNLAEKIEYTATGARVTAPLTWEEYCHTVETWQRIEQSVQWVLGDLLLYGESRWGDKYTQPVEDTGKNIQTLMNYVWISKAYQISDRSEISHTHHGVAAAQDDRLEWLAKAEAEDWSANELRRQIKISKRKPSAALAASTARVTVVEGDMLKVLPTLEQQFDLVVADPPYNVTSWNFDQRGENFLDETRQWLKACLAVVKPKYNLFWFCSPHWMADIEMVMRDMGLSIQSRIVWHRRNMSMGSDAGYKFIDTWECIFHIGNRKLNYPEDWSEGRFDVQTFAVPQSNFEDMKLHPTQKPLGLIQRLVGYGSRDGDAVLDPFAGSGVTGEASLLEGRNCVLVEVDKEYCDVIRKRCALPARAEDASSS